MDARLKSWNLLEPDRKYWVMVHPTALADTYVQSYRRLRSVAARFVPPDEADDMVQEAYVRALTCSHAFRGESAPSTWLYRILVNACLDARRHRQRRGAHVTMEETRAMPRGRRWYRLIDRHALRTALAALESPERDVWVMYDVMGYTHPEISRRMRIPVGTSKGRLCSARRRLRRLLAS
jgi:RNA polymerase sigma-70 factor (ECF subfamily)